MIDRSANKGSLSIPSQAVSTQGFSKPSQGVLPVIKPKGSFEARFEKFAQGVQLRVPTQSHLSQSKTSPKYDFKAEMCSSSSDNSHSSPSTCATAPCFKIGTHDLVQSPFTSFYDIPTPTSTKSEGYFSSPRFFLSAPYTQATTKPSVNHRNVQGIASHCLRPANAGEVCLSFATGPKRSVLQSPSPRLRFLKNASHGYLSPCTSPMHRQMLDISPPSSDPGESGLSQQMWGDDLIIRMSINESPLSRFECVSRFSAIQVSTPIAVFMQPFQKNADGGISGTNNLHCPFASLRRKIMSLPKNQPAIGIVWKNDNTSSLSGQFCLILSLNREIQLDYVYFPLGMTLEEAATSQGWHSVKLADFLQTAIAHHSLE